jgi:hypothetical protein
VLKQIEETNLIQDHKTQADIVSLLKIELHEVGETIRTDLSRRNSFCTAISYELVLTVLV